jgi:hypothetical protein
MAHRAPLANTLVDQRDVGGAAKLLCTYAAIELGCDP